MDKWLEGLEPIVERQVIKVPYRYAMGKVASKFFGAIRDHKKILGIRCPKCQITYVPPRSTCGRCFSLLQDWVEVSDKGTLQTYTIIRYSTPLQPVPPPFVYGIIKLDGADTGLAHLVAEVDFARLRPGLRLKSIFREERKGNMLDILYFKPV